MDLFDDIMDVSTGKMVCNTDQKPIKIEEEVYNYLVKVGLLMDKVPMDKRRIGYLYKDKVCNLERFKATVYHKKYIDLTFSFVEFGEDISRIYKAMKRFPKYAFIIGHDSGLVFRDVTPETIHEVIYVLEKVQVMSMTSNGYMKKTCPVHIFAEGYSVDELGEENLDRLAKLGKQYRFSKFEIITGKYVTYREDIKEYDYNVYKGEVKGWLEWTNLEKGNVYFQKNIKDSDTGGNGWRRKYLGPGT